MSKKDDLASEVLGAMCSAGLTLILSDPPEPSPTERIAEALEKLADTD